MEPPPPPLIEAAGLTPGSGSAGPTQPRLEDTRDTVKCSAGVAPSTTDLDEFFARSLYNSCQATDELMKHIERSQDDSLAKKALHLYQTHYSSLERPWDHVTFMYGLGLIYMHFNAYNWAIKAFREAIYVQPSFSRARDVHTRLGLIFKAAQRYRLSEKHFRLAMNDTRHQSGASSQLELQFHLAHLSEVQGNFEQARSGYERLLQQQNLTPQLSANINRQLGCLYLKNNSSSQQHPTTANNNNNNRIEAALKYFNASHHSDPKTSYYLGRYLIEVGKHQEAFASYRSIIDRGESTADTWCSIGVLYQRQNQLTDALQAYIRSVQFDKQHSTAWMNLGILYENHLQFQDAVKCYQHCLRSSSDGIDKMLLNRIKYLQKQISSGKTTLSNSNGKSSSKSANSDKLIGLEDLWNLESSLVKSKAFSETQSTTSNSIVTTTTTTTTTTNFKTQQQNIKSNSLSNNLSTPNLITNANPVPYLNGTNNNNKLDLISKTNDLNEIKANTTTQNPFKSQQPNLTSIITDRKTSETSNCFKLQEKKNHNCNEVGISKIISSGTQLLNNTNPNSGREGDSLTTKQNLTDNKPINQSTCDASTTNNHDLLKACKIEPLPQTPVDIKEFKPHLHQQQQQLQDTKDFCMDQLLTNGVSKDSGISSNSSTSADCALVPSLSADFDTPNFMSAEQVIEACKNCPKPMKYDINLQSDDNKPPILFCKYPPYPPSDKLYPSPPSIFLETKKDLISKKLQECCNDNPISIIRNLASVLKLDLGLFSTKTLVEINSDHQVDVCRHQYHRTGETDDGEDLKSWLCERHKSISTIGRYASYQVASFRDTLQEESESKLINSKATANNNKESETDSNESASIPPTKRAHGNQTSGQMNSDTVATINNNSITNQHQPQLNQSSTNNANKKFKKELQLPKPIKYVQSAEKIDLSDDNKWRLQLNELNKLPNFIKCISASNMLTHIGCSLPGINSTLMGMHVPGCRLSDNQVPNNFCSVNINVGPGDYEWCAISAEYCSALRRLCNNRGLDIEDKNWWPNLDDLKKQGIPIYRFSQRPGDLVWINSGTMYWIKATGWCNNIQWNVGPLSAKQYKLAAQRVEINKFVFSKSEVPMIQLTWNLVININVIPDNELSEAVADVLRRSLRYCFMVEELISTNGDSRASPRETDATKQPATEAGGKVAVVANATTKGPKTAKFCTNCECEVFNMYFVRESAQHCIECARQSDPSLRNYTMRQDYELSYLMQLYDSFIETRKKLHSHKKQQC